VGRFYEAQNHPFQSELRAGVSTTKFWNEMRFFILFLWALPTIWRWLGPVCGLSKLSCGFGHYFSITTCCVGLIDSTVVPIVAWGCMSMKFMLT
jgi:hypothetical protein